MMFSFGGSERERIEVDVLGYERAAAGEYHDDDRLTTSIRVTVGGFRGKVQAAVAQLRPLCETLRGTAEFTTLEQQLSLRLTGDGRGHIELAGAVEDEAGLGNRLCFTMHIDQSQLTESIRALERVTSAFPVRAVSERLSSARVSRVDQRA